MIKSKNELVINAMEGSKSLVFFRAELDMDTLNQPFVVVNVHAMVPAMNEKNETVLQSIKSVRAVFKKSVFDKRFGKLTVNNLGKKWDQFLIDGIDRVNKHEWTGKENQPFTKFWDLTTDDLEVHDNTPKQETKKDKPTT